MTNPPRASVIINNYNYGRFLRQAIDSALAQTYSNTEVIVVDDGSTDDSRDVIRSYGKRVVPVFKQNGGQGSAFNAGFVVCQGDFVCFLDADDALLPTAMSEAVAAFHASETVKVEWKLLVVDEFGDQTGQVIPEKALPQNLRERTLLEGPFYDWLVTPPSSGNCYSRTFLEQVLPMTEPEFRHGADVYLTVLAPLYGNVIRLSEPQAAYRQHGANNYHCRPLDDARLRDYIQRFESCCQVLSSHLQAIGLQADCAQWRERNFNYLWPCRMLRARQDIASIIPAGESYVFIDNNEWGAGQLVSDRQAIPFRERDGDYAGPPADDYQAIRDLERLRMAGAAMIVIWWTAFWWLDHYAEFARHLREQHECVLDEEHLIIFDLRRSAKLKSGARIVGSQPQETCVQC